MPLFENKARTRTEPLRPGEGRFEFYDERSGPSFDLFREIINRWIAELPHENIPKFITRMNSGEFDSALPELTAHTMLKRLGYSVEMHPEIPGVSKRPDFLVRNGDNNPLFYIEVTTINHSDGRVAHDNREAPIINALDRASLPERCWLSYNLLQAGSASPRIATLVADVERWARAAVAAGEATPEDIPTQNFQTGDWTIEISLIIGAERRGRGRSIGGRMLAGGWLAPSEDIRGALKTKRSRYGKQFEIPFVIVIADLTETFFFGRDFLKDAIYDAFLGDMKYQVTLLADGTRSEGNTRSGNGFWSDRGGVHNRHISAVLVLPDGGLWRLREEQRQPILAINPWASRPLGEEQIPLQRLVPREGKWSLIEGRLLADILEIPTPWPD